MAGTQSWKPGDALPGLEKDAIGRVQIAKFAAAVNDFNPIHVDEEFATKAGFPSVIAHGPLTLSLVAQAIGRAFGPENLRGVHAQFRAPALPGDVLRVEGTVDEIVDRDGERRAVCALRVLRGEDDVVAIGGGEAVIGHG